MIPDKKEASEINWQAASTETAEDTEKESTVSGRALDEKQQEALAEAVALAESSDIVIFVGGLNHDFDVEGLDRVNMKLPYGQDEVIDALLKAVPDTVVCMYAGAPVEMPWAEKAKAILWSYYAGMEGGTALAEILSGKVNPSGKLAETFIRDASQCPHIRSEHLERKTVWSTGRCDGRLPLLWHKKNRCPVPVWSWTFLYGIYL